MTQAPLFSAYQVLHLGTVSVCSFFIVGFTSSHSGLPSIRCDYTSDESMIRSIVLGGCTGLWMSLSWLIDCSCPKMHTMKHTLAEIFEQMITSILSNE
jgi:hypothetical protein